MTFRTARGDETRRQILAAAADLFHKQGVVATSPDQIIEASGTGKGQFYHYFKNKDGLVHEVLQSYFEAIQNGGGPLSYEIASWEDLEQWFLAQVALQKRFRMTRGCPFGTIGNEVTESDELIRQDLSLHKYQSNVSGAMRRGVLSVLPARIERSCDRQRRLPVRA